MNDDLTSLITTKLRERRLTPPQVADATGIPVDIIDQLATGVHDKLPAAPYLHGYLVKLGEFLEFDGEAMWQHMKRQEPMMSSGTKDMLPRNRFSRHRLPRHLFWIIPVVLILALYGIFRFAAILGLPDVAIINPDRDGIVFTQSPILLQGTATPESRLTINGEAVPVTITGTWEKEVILQPGTPNDFSVTATKFLGRSRTLSRRVYFELPILPTSTTSTSTVPALTPTEDIPQPVTETVSSVVEDGFELMPAQ